MNRTTCTFFLSLLLLYNSGCRKEDSGADTGGSTLDKIVYKNSIGVAIDTQLFIYGSQNRLKEIIHHNQANTNHNTETFEYDAQGRYSGYISHTINFINQPVDYRFDFVYNGAGDIEKAIETGIPQTGGSVIFSFAYDNHHRIIADSLHYDPDVVYSYDTYTYDDNDNITGFEDFLKNGDDFTSTGKTSITCENNPNPFYNIGRQLFVASSPYNYPYLTKGNITKEVSSSGETRDHMYTYYSNGLRKTEDLSPNSTFEYFYKKP